jgi:hypothetical protein
LSPVTVVVQPSKAVVVNCNSLFHRPLRRLLNKVDIEDPSFEGRP